MLLTFFIFLSQRLLHPWFVLFIFLSIQCLTGIIQILGRRRRRLWTMGGPRSRPTPIDNYVSTRNSLSQTRGASFNLNPWLLATFCKKMDKAFTFKGGGDSPPGALPLTRGSAPVPLRTQAPPPQAPPPPGPRFGSRTRVRHGPPPGKSWIHHCCGAPNFYILP